MKRFLHYTAAMLVVLLLFGGCAGTKGKPVLSSACEPSAIANEQPDSDEKSLWQTDDFEEPKEAQKNYIVTLADGIAANILEPGMQDADKVKAAYEYVIANTFFAPPVGLDSWRIYDDKAVPSYVENRALSPLAYGIGSCEDYAAALTLLLQRMGFEARYVPGLTISVKGDFVDHAWTAVKIGYTWYHLDSQLEDNVTRNDTIAYRYFLKSDEYMLADHRWGENLIRYGGLSAQQIAEIQENYLLPACTANFRTPAPTHLQQTPRKNRKEVIAKINEKMKLYEQKQGRLDEAELNITPPVFGDTGYGPKD